MQNNFQNKNVRNLVPYRVARHLAWDLGSSNVDVLKLDWNESTVPPTPLVASRINEELQVGRLNWYPDLRNQILLSKLAGYSGVGVDQVDYFSSSDAAHEVIARAFISPGDGVLMFYPTYDNFRVVCESAGAEVIGLLHADLGDIENIIAENKPKLIYICNPNNPTGDLWSRENLVSLINAHPKVLFLIDEAYFEFSEVTLADKVAVLPNLLISRTFSKAFGIASFRLGYVLSHANGISVLQKVKNHKNVPALSQVAGIACLDDLLYMKEYVKEVLRAKKYFIKKLAGFTWVKGVSGVSGNFCYVQCNDSVVEQISSHLEHYSIFIRTFPQNPGFWRVTVGTKSQMERVISALEEFSPVFDINHQ